MKAVCMFPLIYPQEERNKSNLTEVNINENHQAAFRNGNVTRVRIIYRQAYK
jgi:hypothetical protein